jgi:cardiolipin synthase
MKKLASSLILALLAGALAAPIRADDGLPPPPALAAAAGRPVPTSAPSTVVGRYRVRGKHDTVGAYSGRLEIGADLRYVRSVRYESGADARETGAVALEGDGWKTVEGSDAATTGLRSVLVSSAEKPRRTTTYRSTGKDAWSGTFDGGAEQLDRPAGDDSFQLLVDGREAFPSIREAISRATTSVNVQSFIIRGDETGESVTKLLCERARAGCKVRVLLDSVGVYDADKLLDQVKASGGQVIKQHQWYKGLGNSLVDLGKSLLNGIKSLFGGGSSGGETRGLFNHDHRKVIVVDGRVGFAGGMNLANEYEKVWHDVHCRVEGPIVHDMQDAFFDRWKTAGGDTPQERAPYYFDFANVPPSGDLKLRVIKSCPGVSHEVKDTYLAEITRARKKVLIENAYFLNDDVIGALERKAGEGVPVTVIIPGDEHHDLPVVRDAFNWIQNDVVKSGIALWKYQPRMVHAKVATIDGLFATVGSANLDDMALNKLSELNIVAQDARVAQTLEQRIFANDLPQSKKVEETKLSFWQKIKGGALQLIRSVL